MSSRYRDREYDRGEEDYGRRRESEYGRSYGERSQGRSGSGLRDEHDRYEGESRGRGYESGREDYGSSGWESNRGWEGNRDTSDRDRNYGAAGQHYYSGQGSSTGQNWGSDRGYSSGQDRGWGTGSRGTGQTY